MAINLKFDLTGNPEPPTIILANRSGNKLGQLKVNEESIDLSDKFNDTSELSFTVNKYIDDKLTPLWDKIVDFKLIYCKEWDLWMEIKVELDEETETVKTIFGTQLGQAELSQIMLYNIEINTEDDIARDDYKISILYDENDPKASILNRLLEKAPHYSIAHVDPTIAKIQRSFSFDDDSICDAFQEIGEEIGCLFEYPSNSDESGSIQRNIFVYDLQQNCNKCGHRGEFTDKCPKCNSTDITNGYGEDTLIFVTSDELAADGIQFITDTDSVKNCFKLEAGDDLMTATIRNCNPNGTDYIWRFSDSFKEDMSSELVAKLKSYDSLCNRYKNDYVYETQKRISYKEEKTFTVGGSIRIGDTVRFANVSNPIMPKDALVSITYKNGTTKSLKIDSDYDLLITNERTITVNDNVGTYILLNYIDTTEYNNLVDKYKAYNNKLSKISTPIKGYSKLMNAYYNTVDLALYLKSSLMPNIEMSETTAEEQAKLLTASSLSPVAVANISVASEATTNSVVLSMAKIVVKSTYKVQVNESEYNKDTKIWSGNFTVTSYSNEDDTAVSDIVNIEINDDFETFVKQKIEKALNKEDTEDLSISGLFKRGYADFCKELKKYALNPLIAFREACQSCIDILIEQGIGSGDTWGNTQEGSESNLYENLYTPYYKKLMAVDAEIKVRENEINIILGKYDLDGNLIAKGLQTILEHYKTRTQNSLNFERHLGNELWLEFCAYRRDDKYSNDNYISDGLNNAKLFKKAFEFIEVAENEIYKSSELQHSISTTLKNLLSIPKFRPLVNSFKTGNWIRAKIDNRICKLRLLEYKIDFGDFDNIPVEFSDVVKIKNGIADVKSVLSQASSMSSSYNAVQRQASQGEKSNVILNNWIDNGLNATNTKIIGTENQNQVWDKNGILCREYNPITETYSDEQLKIINSTIAITDNNWESTKTAIGKFYYEDLNPSSETYGKLISAYGVNGETIVGKLLIGEQLNISNDDKTLEFGKDGLVVEDDTNTVTINPSADSIINIKKDSSNIFSIDENGDLVIVGKITLLDGSSISGSSMNGLADVAISGSYNDLKDKPNLATVATTGSYNDLKNKPTLSAVATSGSYNDLSNKPTKLSNFTNDTLFINKDVNNLINYYKKTEIDNLLNSLSTVATTGSYKDLKDIEELKTWVLEQIQLAIN